VTEKSSLLRQPLFWVGVLYFAQGFPFGIFYDVLPVYFRRMGVDLREIGFLSLLGLAWTIKFLWAPAIDYYRHHRRWMLAVDLGMGALLLVIAAESGFSPTVQIAIALFALLSATNDIAIDGYTVELLDRSTLGVANGLRNGMYRVGILVAGTILMASAYITWPMAYTLAAVLIAVLGLICLAAPRERPQTVTPQRFFLARLLLAAVALAAAGWALDTFLMYVLTALLPGRVSLIKGLAIVGSVLLPALVAVLLLRRAPVERGTPGAPAAAPLFGALIEMLKRPQIVPVMLFVLTYKLGDVALGPMIKPFWVDAGFTDLEIGAISVNIGLGLSILGGLVGGWIVDRVGIFRALWILGLFQALANLGYFWAASVIPLTGGDTLSASHRVLIYFASANESFSLGLGSAAFLAFLMSIVNQKFAAAEYALLSSLFALTRHLAGFASGFGAQELGYAPYFLLTFFLHFPAYLLLPWVRKMLANVPQNKGASE
jgi:MFS transporter, PAT family, beta-lactamase induction signal transducer AmpG